jgi:hypothetical protein
MKKISLVLLAFASIFFSQTLSAQTMEEMQMMYLSVLEKNELTGTIDGDGDVQFKYDNFTYFIDVDEDDPEYFGLVLANIWPIESELERLQVLKAADMVNASKKVAKVYINNDNVWITYEDIQKDVGDFEAYFERSLQIISQSVSMFRENMN